MSVKKGNHKISRYTMTEVVDERRINRTAYDVTFSASDKLNSSLVSKKVEYKKNYFKRRLNYYNLDLNLNINKENTMDFCKFKKINNGNTGIINFKSRNVKKKFNNDSVSDSLDSNNHIRLLKTSDFQRKEKKYQPYYNMNLKLGKNEINKYAESLENLPTQTSRTNNKFNNTFNISTSALLKSCEDAEIGFHEMKKTYTKQLNYFQKQIENNRKVYKKERDKPHHDMINLANDDLKNMRSQELRNLFEKRKKDNDYHIISKLNEITAFNVQPVINTRMGMKKQVQVRKIRLENGVKKHELICSLNAKIDNQINRLFDKFKLKRPGNK